MSDFQPQPHEALQRLLEGNQRYSAESSTHPNRDRERREATLKEQRPFAAIVGCSDSRVAAEILFDQGIGDLFVVRTAGSVIGPIELASLEFAVLQLKVSLVFVLGHENCGAIQAVLEGKNELIQPVADLIEEALEGKRPPITEAIKKNAQYNLDKLGQIPNFAALVEEEKLLFAGGYYNLLSGEVQLLTH